MTTLSYDPSGVVPGPISVLTAKDSEISTTGETHYVVQNATGVGPSMLAANMLTQVDEAYSRAGDNYYGANWTTYEAKTINGMTAYVPTKTRSWIADEPSATKPVYNINYPGSDITYNSQGLVEQTNSNTGLASQCTIFQTNGLPVASFGNTDKTANGKSNVFADEFGDLSFSNNSPVIWNVGSGTWSVTNLPASKGELSSGASGNNIVQASAPLNLQAFSCEFDLRIIDDNGNGQNNGGIEFRKNQSGHTVENSGYFLFFRSSGMMGIKKGTTVLNEIQTGITSRQVHIKITGNGSTMTIWADGRNILSITDATYTGDFIGLRSENAKCYFDNVVVYPLSATYSMQSYDPSTLDVLYTIDANGQKVSYEYDTLGRLIRARGPNGETLKEVTYKYSTQQ